MHKETLELSPLHVVLDPRGPCGTQITSCCGPLSRIKTLPFSRGSSCAQLIFGETGECPLTQLGTLGLFAWIIKVLKSPSAHLNSAVLGAGQARVPKLALTNRFRECGPCFCTWENMGV